MVLGVPEQGVVALMRDDVIDYGCCLDPVLLLATNAERVVL